MYLAASPETIQLNMYSLVTIFVSVFLPIVVGLFTKMTTHPLLKMLALLVLTAAGNFLGQYLAAPDGFPWATASLTALIGLAVAIASHYGVWKVPLGNPGSSVIDLAQKRLVKSERHRKPSKATKQPNRTAA